LSTREYSSFIYTACIKKRLGYVPLPKLIPEGSIQLVGSQETTSSFPRTKLPHRGISQFYLEKALGIAMLKSSFLLPDILRQLSNVAPPASNLASHTFLEPERTQAGSRAPKPKNRIFWINFGKKFHRDSRPVLDTTPPSFPYPTFTYLKRLSGVLCHLGSPIGALGTLPTLSASKTFTGNTSSPLM